MKINIVTYISLVCVLISCAQSSTRNTTTIKGQLLELATKEIQINLKDSVIKTIVDMEGKFDLNISLDKLQYAYSKELDRRIFLLPSDSLLIRKKDDKYIFSGGQSALINNYYTDWKTYLYAVADTSASEKYYNQKPIDFLNSVDNWIEIWKKPLYELQLTNPNINKDFVAFENARIKYWMYGDLNDYKSENAKIPDNFYQYLNEVDLNDLHLFQLDEYKYFLRSYVFMQVRRAELNDKILETSKMLDIIKETFKHEAIINEVSKEVMRVQTSHLNINDTLFEKFKTICTDNFYIKEVDKSFQSLRPLLKGNKAPDFEFLNVNGNKVSLNDFKGKYLLIDAWSTTCAPCIREIPNMEKLIHDFEGKNIDFIAACLSDESAWKAVMAKYKLTKGQYRIENGWKSGFRNDYLKSSGVPVYILIDPKGFILNARAPKPSEGLDKLLNSLDL